MRKYRSRLEVIADILSAVSSNDAKKTRIMYLANLSYKLLGRYLGEVVNAKLVVCNNEDCYILTPKGEQFLNRYGEYCRLCENLQEQFNLIDGEKSALEKMIVSEEVTNNNANNLGKDGLNRKPQSDVPCQS